MPTTPFERSRCPIANVLDLFGDRWTLLVVRDLLLAGRHRFAELEAGGESIPTNILADRLERLQAARIVSRRRYQKKPPRYEYHLTKRGRDLAPVLREMGVWAGKHLPGTFRPTPRMMEILAGGPDEGPRLTSRSAPRPEPTTKPSPG
jgi:DNA-binding HxlR family transcriptional regulator